VEYLPHLGRSPLEFVHLWLSLEQVIKMLPRLLVLVPNASIRGVLSAGSESEAEVSDVVFNTSSIFPTSTSNASFPSLKVSAFVKYLV